MNVGRSSGVRVCGAVVLVVAGVAGGLWMARPVDAQAGAVGMGGGKTPSIADVSYALGHDLGREIAAGLGEDKVQPDLDKLVQGFSDGLRNKYPSLSAKDIHDVLVVFNTEVQRRKTAERLKSDPVFKALAENNALKAKQFMDRFGQKEGAKSLDGGIEYLVIDSGSGAMPTRDDQVVVTFRALLTDGVEVASGTNVTVPVSSVVEGAQRVLTSMKAGDHWYVAIPPSMAFGEIGRPPDIGPNEVIVADIQLVSVLPKAP